MIRQKLTDGKLTEKQIIESIQLDPIIPENKAYYSGSNYEAVRRYNEKIIKGVMPNNYLSSPYYSTIVDGLAGYAFGDIKYLDNVKDEADAKDIVSQLTLINGYNQADVKNIAVALGQIGIGVCYVIHWVDKSNGNKYMFSPIDPECGFPVYDYSIANNLIAFIHKAPISDSENMVKVYYDKSIDTYLEIGGKLQFQESAPNDYKEIPVEIYYTNYDKEIISICEKVKPYINAMDAILKGNWDEIDKGMQSILLHLSDIKKSDVDDMAQKKAWKVAVEEIGQIRFLTKEIQWEYQKFFYEIVKTEIHKHAHVIDFTDPETGVGTPQSGKALQYRLIDMNNMAVRLEQMNREGQYKRLRLLENIKALPAGSSSQIMIEYNHSLPDETIELLGILNNDSILSTRTKLELLKLDPNVEMQRKQDEEAEDVTRIMDRSIEPDKQNNQLNETVDNNDIDM